MAKAPALLCNSCGFGSKAKKCIKCGKNTYIIILCKQFLLTLILIGTVWKKSYNGCQLITSKHKCTFTRPLSTF